MARDMVMLGLKPQHQEQGSGLETQWNKAGCREQRQRADGERGKKRDSGREDKEQQAERTRAVGRV